MAPPSSVTPLAPVAGGASILPERRVRPQRVAGLAVVGGGWAGLAFRAVERGALLERRPDRRHPDNGAAALAGAAGPAVHPGLHPAPRIAGGGRHRLCGAAEQ